MHVPDHCWVAVFVLAGLRISECFCFLYFCSCNENEAGMTPSGKLLCVLVKVQPSPGYIPTVPGWDTLKTRNLFLLSDSPGPHLQSQMFNSLLNGTLFSPLLIPKNSIWAHAGMSMGPRAWTGKDAQCWEKDTCGQPTSVSRGCSRAPCLGETSQGSLGESKT